MPFLTVFLAKLIGIYCVVIAAAMLLRRRETIRTINAMVDDPGMIMIAGVIALMGGIAMVLGHNVWTGGVLPIAVTVGGWVIAAKGAMLLLMPSSMLRRFFEALRYDRFFILYMGVTLLLGICLAGAGFSQ